MLVTLEEFRASRYNNASYTDEQILSALLYAETRFYTLTNREHTGYWLEPKERVLLLDGSGTSILMSPYPLISVSRVRILEGENWVDVTSKVRVRGHFLALTSGVFPEDFATVEVTAQVGDPRFCGRPVPEDVKEAVRRLAHMKLRRHRLIAGEEMDEHRPPTEPPPPPTMTGDREVDGIIKSYYVAPALTWLDLRGPLD